MSELENLSELLRDIRFEIKSTKDQLSGLREDVSVQAETIRNIEKHLATLNGSVARHEKQIGNQTIEMLAHVANCALRADVARIESSMNTQNAFNKGSNEANARWMKNMKPLLWVILGAITTLVLLEARNFLP